MSSGRLCGPKVSRNTCSANAARAAASPRVAGRRVRSRGVMRCTHHCAASGICPIYRSYRLIRFGYERPMSQAHLRPELELRHLWYFVAVAEELSFGRAARRVGIAQPPLSQQIRRLEDTLGCTLFDRSGRRVRLTDAGSVLVTEARRLLADAAHTTPRTRTAGRGEVGTVTIGYWSSTLFSPLPAAVRRFRERFPDVAVRLRERSPPH